MYTIALVGAPNVGKSTVFNALTGLRRHTGNWSGKTVDAACGRFTHRGTQFDLVDTPGTYSLAHASAEEEVTRDFLLHGSADAAVLVADATCLEKSVRLALELTQLFPRTVMCVNLMDEAEKRGVTLDLPRLSAELGIPVIPTCAARGEGLSTLCDALLTLPDVFDAPHPDTHDTVRTAEEICRRCVRAPEVRASGFDRAITTPAGALLSTLLLLTLVFWLTVRGANYPSELLMRLFSALGLRLSAALTYLGINGAVHSALIHGVYTTLSWVVAVMLPPMAIFFPLFSILEDSGLLPRIAFNLDSMFRRTGAGGKQALTMCMSFGCNACGVCGARIIRGEGERRMACITSSLVPCNGRFPMMLTLISAFVTSSPAGASLVMTALILLSVGMTLLMNLILSKTRLCAGRGTFTLELPPYRLPRIGRVILRTVQERTLSVLGRAAAFAAPAGLVIWCFANLRISGATLLTHAAEFLDPAARLIGLDGVILLAFILALPAKEIILPLILMGYTHAASLAEVGSLSAIAATLTLHGWTRTTALCTLVFTLFHFPCATVIRTVWRETRSPLTTAAAVFLPLIAGALLSAAISLFFS